MHFSTVETVIHSDIAEKNKNIMNRNFRGFGLHIDGNKYGVNPILSVFMVTQVKHIKSRLGEIANV